ncbi:MAG: hypothetical protein WC376_03605 [Candidatus Nanoarchaeia archaeon]
MEESVKKLKSNPPITIKNKSIKKEYLTVGSKMFFHLFLSFLIKKDFMFFLCTKNFFLTASLHLFSQLKRKEGFLCAFFLRESVVKSCLFKNLLMPAKLFLHSL